MNKRKILKFMSVVFSTTIIVTLAAGCSNKLSSEEKNVSKDPVKKEVVAVYERGEVQNSNQALKLLKEGNERFVENKLENIDLSDEKRKTLTKGQKPFAVVIGCSDSRVAPELLFNQGLGDLFVIRVAGNVLDKDEIGSIEYAVDHLDTPLVVVLGHESCGAVTAAVHEEGSEENYIGAIVEKIQPSVEKAKHEHLEGKELVEKAIDENIEYVQKQLKDKSSIIKEKLKNKKIQVVGAKYMLESGKVEWLNE